ncbi:hypothetical protein V6N12_061647 [Hibiscus sabdariffa]|uniref:Uncharacterized protein n=1 Tax=Hibiscus sabdariffa TaxID=183260 RepID=A0ABR2DXN8_9ROSI
MFSYPPQITESQPVTNIHDTHASLVGGLPAGRPPNSIPPIVDPLEATMTEAEADLIMSVSAGKEIVGDPAMAENNQSGQQLSFKDMLLGKSVDTMSKGAEELDVEVGADDVRIAMNGLVPEIHFSDKSSQVPVGGSVNSVVDGAPTVESRQAATDLYGPWMHVTRRRRRAARNKRDSIENRARGSLDTQASGSRFAALQDHGLNDGTGSEGDRVTTRAGIMHDGVNMAGKGKEVHPNRSRQTRFAGGNSSMPFTKSVVNRPTITINGPGECSSEAGPIQAVGELHEVQVRVKKGNHTAVRISDPVEIPVVLIEDPVIGSAGGNSIMQPSHRGLSVSKSSSKKGARIRRLADVRKSTLPILGEWVNSVTRELSIAAEPPGVVSSVDKENVHVHQDLIEASVHWSSDIPSKGNHHHGDGQI